ncbi:hypothetical protein UlMin_045018 [Ulmus minor]
MSRERPKRATLPPAQENVDKLAKVVEGGNYYGAQQMYKSISASDKYYSCKKYIYMLYICINSSYCFLVSTWLEKRLL